MFTPPGRGDSGQVCNDWETARPHVIKLAVEEILKHHLHIREDTVERVLEDIAAPSRERSAAASHYGEYRKYLPAEESRRLMIAIIEAARRAGDVVPRSASI
jgi:hypothetical protein